MNGADKLKELYKLALNLKSKELSYETEQRLHYLKSRIASNKGVYTVLITLGIYKILYPKQDIRYHKVELENGFSGRSFDTTYITPTLKKLGLLSMAESGWLTRSLEQAYPYDSTYNGKITPVELKEVFLFLVNKIQFDANETEAIVIKILSYAIEYKRMNTIKIAQIDNAEKLTIIEIVNLLEKHFFYNYKTHGGSKLPVIAFYVIYKQLIPEIKRYSNCELQPLGSHTASDKTSKSSGDIEITKHNSLFESVEIKHDRLIDANMLRIAQEKIYRFNPIRYYILSSAGLKDEDCSDIYEIINEIKQTHGCQIIVNGIIYTIKYYLRLIESLSLFLNNYIEEVEKDNELKIEHKQVLKSLLNKYHFIR